MCSRAVHVHVLQYPHGQTRLFRCNGSNFQPILPRLHCRLARLLPPPPARPLPCAAHTLLQQDAAASSGARLQSAMETAGMRLLQGRLQGRLSAGPSAAMSFGDNEFRRQCAAQAAAQGGWADRFSAPSAACCLDHTCTLPSGALPAVPAAPLSPEGSQAAGDRSRSPDLVAEAISPLRSSRDSPAAPPLPCRSPAAPLPPP